MSLNGLDSTILKEAYDAAVAEPGGWFLLSYATRDEIELLDRGSGGIVQIRKRIAEYTEESPLFGYLTYRRRKVLIKYIPEGVSRLVQARVTVHFGAVTDRFTPSTVFEIVSSKELKDNTLSAACSLHTASGSTSSSTSSLRQRRLIEIEEEEEDNRRQSVVVEEHTPEAKAALIDEPFDKYSDDTGYGAPTTELPELLKADTYQSPESQPNPDHDPEHLTLVPIISLDPAARPSTEYDSSRTSINQERPSFADSTRSELSTYTSYTSSGRQKVKLGPRPSIDTPAQGSFGTQRPVSSLPAGLKLLSRNSKKNNGRLPPTASNKTLLSPTMEGVISAPQDASSRPVSAGRPTSGSGTSIKSTLSTCTVTSRISTASADQAKLMKALEMRKKKMAASANAQTQTDLYPTQVPLPVDACDLCEEHAPTASADESGGTAHSSMPASPFELAAPNSELTRASSVSDATDETVKEYNESKKDSTAADSETEADIPESEKPASADGTHEGTSVARETTVDGKTEEKDEAATQNATVEKSKKEDQIPAAAAAIVEPVKAVLSAVANIVKPQTVEDTEEPVESKSETAQTPIIVNSKPELQINGKSNDEVNLLHAPPGPHPVMEAYPPALDKSADPIIDDGASSKAAKALTEISDPDVNAPKREMKMPLSKFSVQKENEQPYVADDADVASISSAPKRRTLIAPIITDRNVNQRSRPTSDLFNDDDLMDELQSATVQEAKPISLPKSPGRAMFSNDINKSETAGERVSRTVSNPHQLLGTQQRPEPSRSASASWLNRSSQQQSTPLVKKVNLGGGIAQRIKALEKLSTAGGGGGGGGGPTSQPGSAVSTGPSPTFFGVGRKTNGSSAQSIAERANSLTRRPPSSSSVRGGDSSPEQQFMGRGRTLSTTSRQGDSAYSHSPMGLTGRSRPDSRPYSAKSLAAQATDNIGPSYSRTSPPVTDQQRALVAEVHKTSQERLTSPSKGRRTSITAVKDLISDTRKSFSERRKSTTLDPITNLNRSPTRPDLTHHNSSAQSGTSNRSSQDFGGHSPSIMSDENSEKKASRASRMLHRISSSVSASRKTISHAMSPTVREESEPSFSSPTTAPTAPVEEATMVLQMGDVNVQFPDNLLWKRRAMCLDSHGYLILTQSQTGTDRNTGAKKYHLAEFTRPAVPDIDMEEMPNSVVLSFVVGSGLQFACADRQGQMWVLKQLQEAHANWTQQ